MKKDILLFLLAVGIIIGAFYPAADMAARVIAGCINSITYSASENINQ